MQSRLTEGARNTRVSGPYNVVREGVQRVRITEGCPHSCPFCYEPKEIRNHGVPEIVVNHVEVMDMNLLAHPDADGIIEELSLGAKKIELICGVDYRFLSPERAKELKRGGFVKIRLAWDWGMGQQDGIRKAVKMLTDAGYKAGDLMVFMLCNWKITREVCEQKLDVLKVWGVKVGDCYFDNQVFPNVIPLHWTDQELRSFRKKCRKHNQLIAWGFDPEVKQREL